MADVPPKLRTSFQQGGMPGIALLGPGGSRPELPVEGLQLSAGLKIYLYEEDDDIDGSSGYLQVNGVVSGWNNRYKCWYATYDWDAIKWASHLRA